MRILSRTFRTRARLGTLLLLLPLMAGCEGDATGLAEQRVGPEGGVVSLEGGAVRISIPAGALSEEIWFTAMPTAAFSGTAPPPGPACPARAEAISSGVFR